MSDRRRDTGRHGEAAAAAHLTRLGYRVVDANWRTRFGELDLIAWHGATLVFVEVRTRTTRALGTGAESVGPAKQRKLRHMSEQYLQQHAPTATARIDVVSVYLPAAGPPEIEHIIGAV